MKSTEAEASATAQWRDLAFRMSAEINLIGALGRPPGHFNH
jgi:hypothetical protein